MPLTVSTALLSSIAPFGTSQEELDAVIEASEDDVNASALVLWWEYRNKLLSGPAKWSAQGDYSEDNTVNIAEVNKRCAHFERLVGVGAGAVEAQDNMITSTSMVRGDRSTLFIGARSPDRPANRTDAQQYLIDRLQQVSQALALVSLLRWQDLVSLTADVPVEIDLTMTDPAMNEIVSVMILDEDNVEVTSISTTITNAVVTLESSVTVSGYTLIVVGRYL